MVPFTDATVHGVDRLAAQRLLAGDVVAAVDGYERPKPLLYGLRHAYADRLLTVQPTEGGLRVALVNDTAQEWIGELEIDRRHYDGTVFARQTAAIRLSPWSSLDVELDGELVVASEPARELVRACLGTMTAHWFFAEYRDCDLRARPCTADATPRAGWDVTLTATTVAREVALLVDRVDPDAVADDALLTLLPGDSVMIRVEGAVGADPSAFADPLVLRSANDLVDR